MKLKQTEMQTIQDLMTQEQSCITKYEKYSKEAKDPELKKLFKDLKKREQIHYDSLNQVLQGTCPDCDVNDSAGEEYMPVATYDMNKESADKKSDAYLATDAIGTEKLVSGEYNSDIFNFEDACVRKLLADIQVEEQNHAEMLYKYKTANGMA